MASETAPRAVRATRRPSTRGAASSEPAARRPTTGERASSRTAWTVSDHPLGSGRGTQSSTTGGAGTGPVSNTTW